VVAREIELCVASGSVYVAHGGGGAAGGGVGMGSVGGGGGGRLRSRDWYSQKVRQLLYNLRGGQNATLRQKVFSGEVRCSELHYVAMCCSELQYDLLSYCVLH